jgi:sulfate permease, SulP family
VVAGVTLAGLAVPEVLGYARIAGMPVETGLYTLLLPVVVFALLGSSRHLVVGADSATAAILAAGLAGLAVPASARYVQLAGTAALLVAALLLLARLARLGFLADFLSRTVLVGFLTGVGIQVAAGQLGDMLGIRTTGASLPDKIVEVATGLPGTNAVAVAVSASVIVLVLGLRRVSRRIPGALVAVVAAIAAGHALDLPLRDVDVLGQVPGGLPLPSLPGVSLADARALIPTVAAMCVVILAQSAATARAYAARYDEQADTDSDLVGLAGANVGAALTGSFVVNGSPTKTQMVDEAGGRSQLAQLAAAATVFVVVVALTGLLDALPLAALASVVFLIGVDLVDVAGMRRIYAVRRTEFVVAALTALTVVLLGVETGIAVAIVASIIDHLRHSYEPHNVVLVKSPAGHWRSLPVTAGARTAAGLVIYRFGSGLYFANAVRFADDVALLTRSGPALTWFCLDGAAIGDVDFSAAAVLARVQTRLRDAGVRMVLANINESVAAQLERYGLTATLGPGASFDTAGEVLEAYRTATAGG